MFFSLIGSSILVPNSSAQEDTQIPAGLKTLQGGGQTARFPKISF